MFEYVVVEPFHDLAGRLVPRGEVVPAIAAELHRGHVVRRIATAAPVKEAAEPAEAAPAEPAEPHEPVAAEEH
jgi:hypothetical protein